jgi:ABC-2 type transport system permease protein
MSNNFTFTKILTIIRHEYMIRIKSKGFIIGTVLAPVGLLLLIAIPIVVALLSADQTSKMLAVVDYSSSVGVELVKTDSTKYFLTQDSESELKEQILSGTLDGFLVISKDILESGNADIYTSGGGGIGYMTLLQQNLNNIVRRSRLVDAGADPSTIELIEKRVSINSQKVTKEGVQTDYTAIYAGLGYALGFAIYMLMFIYGQLVMRGVIEEKANRIIEILASSARPIEIMMGKVLGIGLVGLTQVIAWIVLAALMLGAATPILSFITPDPAMMTAQMEMMPQDSNPAIEILQNIADVSISPWIAIGFVFYFLAGYFIYSALFAAVGSAVDQEQDAAQLMIPITIPIIIPILFIFNIMSNPDGTLAVVLSLIPFFTPILMIVRVAATSVPIWQIATSVVLMFATFYGCLWVAAKIYRVGILMYGKKPNFKDLYKWIRTSQ